MNDNITDNKTSRPNPRPYWWPEGIPIDQLPGNLRAAIEGLIQPAYEKLVVAARPGAEQSTGATIVNLLWLEVLQQTELGRDLVGSGQQPERLVKHERSIARMLRLAGAKIKASDFLHRLHSHRHKMSAGAATVGTPSERTSAVDGLSPA